MAANVRVTAPRRVEFRPLAEQPNYSYVYLSCGCRGRKWDNHFLIIDRAQECWRRRRHLPGYFPLISRLNREGWTSATVLDHVQELAPSRRPYVTERERNWLRLAGIDTWNLPVRDQERGT